MISTEPDLFCDHHYLSTARQCEVDAEEGTNSACTRVPRKRRREMLGKRPTMRRTSSVSLIGSGAVNGESSPLPEHPKEKLKCSSNSSSAPRQVIGFHPKVFIDEELELSSTPTSPRRSSPPPQQAAKGSPSGSPRSGLGDLLAGSRPWERKDEGVGLGIVAALSGSQEEVGKMVYSSPSGSDSGYVSPSRKTPSSQVHHPAHMPSVFAPARASPPIFILPSNSGYPCPPHCPPQYCSPVPPSSGRPESMFVDRDGGGSRPNASWLRPDEASHAGGISWGQHQQQADMDVDKIEPVVSSPLRHVSPRHNIPSPSARFSQHFLDACHLCRRRLGEGRDIYIYRGDRAFCSPECRHQQMANDKQPEKCSSTVMKMGGSDTRSTTQRNRVIPAGTAAAA